ncbi:MAG: hypothetical protein HYY84_01340 [Deltaproteobacteria bacterium]|nr:hypothetical protein [Deltaproteobacteria bacterium]
MRRIITIALVVSACGAAPSEPIGPNEAPTGPPANTGGIRDAGARAGSNAGESDAGAAHGNAVDGGADAGTTPEPTPARGPSPRQDPALGLNAYFSRQDNLRAPLHALIDSARQSLKVAVFTLSDASTITRLALAKARGVAVDVLIDSKQDGTPQAAALLRAAGIEPTLIDNRHSANAIQHNKFVVVDDARVATGSVNWTYTGFDTNDENLVTIDNAAIAQRFAAVWSGMRTASIPRGTYNAVAPLAALFSPVDAIADKIVARLNVAQTSIHLALYHATHNGLRDALKRAVSRGVRVIWVTDFDLSQSTDDDEAIAQAGGTVLRVRPTLGRDPHMHNKYVIIDASRVFTGSFNWTNGAAYDNYENVIETSSAPIVARYEGAFLTLLRRYDPAFTAAKYGFADGVARVKLTIDRTRAPAGILVAPRQPGLAFNAARGATVEYRVGIMSSAGAVTFDKGPLRYFVVPFAPDAPEVFDVWVD